MKQIRFIINDQRQVTGIKNTADQMPLDGSTECVFQNAKVSKTLAQLGTLFGFWIEEICKQSGMDDRELHLWLKMEFLAPIYATDPQSYIQQMWADNYWNFMEARDAEALSAHLLEISMQRAWGLTKDQMSEYMNKIQRWGINAGFRLTVPNKFHRYYKQEMNNS